MLRLQQARERVLEYIRFAESAAEDEYDCETMKAWRDKPENKNKEPEDDGLEVMDLLYRGEVQPCIVRATMEEGQFKLRKREGNRLQNRETLDDGQAIMTQDQMERKWNAKKAQLDSGFEDTSNLKRSAPPLRTGTAINDTAEEEGEDEDEEEEEEPLEEDNDYDSDDLLDNLGAPASASAGKPAARVNSKARQKQAAKAAAKPAAKPVGKIKLGARAKLMARVNTAFGSPHRKTAKAAKPAAKPKGSPTASPHADDEDLDPEEYLQRSGKAVVDKQIQDLLKWIDDNEPFQQPTDVNAKVDKKYVTTCKDVQKKLKSIQTDIINIQWKVRKRVGCPQKVKDAIQVFRQHVSNFGELWQALGNLGSSDANDVRVLIREAKNLGAQIPWICHREVYKTIVQDQITFNLIDELFNELKVDSNHMLAGSNMESRIVNLNAALLENSFSEIFDGIQEDTQTETKSALITKAFNIAKRIKDMTESEPDAKIVDTALLSGLDRFVATFDFESEDGEHQQHMFDEIKEKIRTMDTQAGLAVMLAGATSWETISGMIQENIDSKTATATKATVMTNIHSGLNNVDAGKLETKNAKGTKNYIESYIDGCIEEGTSLHSEFTNLMAAMSSKARHRREEACRSLCAIPGRHCRCCHSSAPHTPPGLICLTSALSAHIGLVRQFWRPAGNQGAPSRSPIKWLLVPCKTGNPF